MSNLKYALCLAFLLLAPSLQARHVYVVGTETRLDLKFFLMVTKCEPPRWVEVEGKAVEASPCGFDGHWLFTTIKAVEVGDAVLKLYQGTRFGETAGCHGGDKKLIRSVPVKVLERAWRRPTYPPVAVKARELSGTAK